MNTFNIIFIAILSLHTLVILFFALKSHKFFKTLLFNAFLGLCVLAIIDLTAKYSGLYIPLNPYSVISSGVFGIPAVSLFLAIQALII